ncbi:MAG: TetR/AcrR family transcriptional regulator [Nevskiales bacterium]
MIASRAALRARQRLPKGRHPLTRQAVASSQRARLLAAMAQTVAEKGFAATTVADVVERAWVSRKTFYEMFPDKEACFLAAYDDGREFLLLRIRDALQDLPEGDWRARAKRSVQAYLEALAERPEAAWTYSIEVFAAGSKALERHAQIMQHWVTQWRRLQQSARLTKPATSEHGELRLRALVGGIEELVRECLRSRGAKHLPALAAPIAVIAVAAIGG